MSNPPIEIKLTADDQASPKIDAVARKVDGLDAAEARVIISADISKLEKQLDRARQDLERLDGDEAVVQSRLVGKLEEDLRQANQLFAQLDGKTGVVRIDAKTDDAVADIGRLEDAIGRLGPQASGISSVLSSLGAAGGAGALAAAFALAAKSAADTAIEVAEVAKLSNGTLEEASRLVAVFNDAGVETRDLQDILVQVSDVLSTNAELAAELGINVNDGRSQMARFVQVTQRLNLIDPIRAGTIAAKVFGEEGVRQVNRVETRLGDIDTAMSNIASNRIISEEDTAAALELNAEFTALAGQVKGLVLEIGGPLVDAINVAIDVTKTLSDVYGDIFQAEPSPKLQEAFDKSLEDAGYVKDEIGGWQTEAEAAAAVIEGRVLAAFEDSTGAAEGTSAAVVDVQANLDAMAAAAEADTERMAAAFDALDGRIDADQSIDDLKVKFADLRTAAAEAWSAGVTGADDAAAKQKTYRDLLREVTGDVLTLSDDLDLVSDDRTAAIALDYDQQDIDGLEDQLADLEKDRKIKIFVELIGGKKLDYTVPPSIAAPDDGTRAVPATTTDTGQAGTLDVVDPLPTGPVQARESIVTVKAGQPIINNTTVYVTVPTSDPSATVAAVSKWARRNGQMPGINPQ